MGRSVTVVTGAGGGCRRKRERSLQPFRVVHGPSRVSFGESEPVARSSEKPRATRSNPETGPCRSRGFRQGKSARQRRPNQGQVISSSGGPFLPGTSRRPL